MQLLVVDDHQIMRDGLAALLRHASPETTVLQARDAHEALTLIDRHHDLDAIILDLMMPGMDGFQAISVFGRTRVSEEGFSAWTRRMRAGRLPAGHWATFPNPPASTSCYPRSARC